MKAYDRKDSRGPVMAQAPGLSTVRGTVRTRTRRLLVLGSSLVAILLLVALQGGGGTIVGSAHDLSTTTTPEPCVFCHTPHSANTRIQGPLWNRFVDPDAAFTVYPSGGTMHTTVPQPSPVSRLCLGCHDGVNATTAGNAFSGSTKHDLIKPPGHPSPDTTSLPNCSGCHADLVYDRAPKMLGTDLSDDHPISFTYDAALAAADGALVTPSSASKVDGAGVVRLFGGKVECASCHDVHNPDNAPFLVKANTKSALCLTCHSM